MNKKLARKLSGDTVLRQLSLFLNLDIFLALIALLAIEALFGRIEIFGFMKVGLYYEMPGNSTWLMNLGFAHIYFPNNPTIWSGFGRIMAYVGIVELVLFISYSMQTIRRINWNLRDLERIEKTAQSISQNETGSELSTDKLGYEREVRSLHEQLEIAVAAYNSQVRFVSDASHELRTPIAVIDGYANMLDRWGKEDSATLEESIAAIKKETAAMKDLVEQLLFLARGDTDTIILDKKTFDLHELALETTEEFTMIDKHHVFTVKGESASVMADRSLIKQALRILIDNAVKYSDDGEKITLITEKREKEVSIAVSDNGIGIPSAMLPKIFDRFTRADASRARATGGAGLGLAIAFWIARRHEGRIDVLSRENIGTRFTITLPDNPNMV